MSMKGNDEITGLFRGRLADAEMTVRDGFWEELQSDLSQIGTGAAGTTAAFASGLKQRRAILTPRFYRVAAAASVVMVLGAASAAFLYFSPKEEIQEAFTKVATLTPDGNLNGDAVQEKFPSIHEANPTTHKPAHTHPSPTASAAALVADEEGDETMSVTVSIRFTQRVYGSHQQGGSESGYHNATESVGNASSSGSAVYADNSESAPAPATTRTKLRNWALKAGIGTSLPKGDFGMPFTAGLSAERRLNKHLSLEAGLQYNRLDAGKALHTLAVPVKLNAMLASSSKVDFYATLGGAAEKCIAGAEDNGFGAEPIQLSVAAGLGIHYKLNDRIALFAEPTVSHHFDTDSSTKTLRTERPTNINLLCGVRMTY